MWGLALFPRIPRDVLCGSNIFSSFRLALLRCCHLADFISHFQRLNEVGRMQCTKPLTWGFGMFEKGDPNIGDILLALLQSSTHGLYRQVALSCSVCGPCKCMQGVSKLVF